MADFGDIQIWRDSQPTSPAKIEFELSLCLNRKDQSRASSLNNRMASLASISPPPGRMRELTVS